MSQFEGNKLKVRCIDCTKFFGNRCITKNTKVTAKKKRLCGIYEFKGEFENRTPAEAIYTPHVDRKTRRMIQKLLKMGVLSVSEEGTVEIQDGFERTKELPIPTTTATAQLSSTEGGVYRPEGPEVSDPNLDAAPSSEIGIADDESKNNWD